MKHFPESIHVKNKENFPGYTYERLKCYLRRDLYEHIIGKPEEEYFSLDEFNKKVGELAKTKKMVLEVIPELEKLGWK